MSSITALMGIAKSGLLTAQEAINVTGENIANVDTDGYSRQTVTLAEAYVTDTAKGSVGSGVWAEGIQRSFDQYVENQYYQQSTLSDRWETLYTDLSNTESLFNESSGYGLSSTLDDFFNSWETLTEYPTTDSVRTTVVDDGQSLATSLNEMYSDLSTQQSEADSSIEEQVSEVNDVLSQIAALNGKIASTSANTNSLQDSRSSLVRELAGYMDINYITNTDGSVTITTQAGQTLVDGTDSYTISYDGPQATSALSAGSSFDGDVYFSGSDTQEYTLQVVKAGGVTSGADAAQFRVSVDGGKTWLQDSDGNDLLYSARCASSASSVGELSIWFGTDSDDSTAPTTTLSVGDKFTITPMKALYWNENTSTKENITPYTDSSGEEDSTRLTGGTLSALCSYKNDYLGAYKEKLDSLSSSLIWEVNRLHSQGTGTSTNSYVDGTYSVRSDSVALGSNSSGLNYGSKLSAGTAFLYVYNSSTGLQASGGALDFSSNGSGLNFDPATDSLDDVCDAINNTFGTYLTANIVNHTLSITANDGYTFAFGTDTTGLYAALGLNTYFTGTGASDIAVNSTVSNNLDLLCSGQVDGSGQTASGDITTASSISDLVDTDVSITSLRGGTVTQSLSTYYSTLVSTVGADTSHADYQYEYTSALASDLDDQQQSVSGVNLDEELTNLIKYQHAYTAAAKLITTADDMMDTLLSLKS